MLDLEAFLRAKQITVSNLLLANYKKIGLTDQELVLFLQLLSFQEVGEDFPDLTLIGIRMQEESSTIYHGVQSLISKKIIQLNTTKDQEGKTFDQYDLTPVYHKLSQLLESEKKQDQKMGIQNKTKDLYQLFEKEFGRPLSPIELETIGMWIEEDKYGIELIRLALREAVLNQAYSLKYMDRILLAWERKNIKTKEQVMQDQKKRKRQMLEQEITQSTKELPTVPLFNWLDPKNQKEKDAE